MPYQLLDDGFAEHPKIMDLSDRSFRLHVAALCYCNRNLTDGLLSQRGIAVLCALTSASKKHLIELVTAGVWDEYEPDGCFLIHDYLEHNPSKAEVQERRAKRSAAGRKGGKRSGKARAQANAEANAEANASKQVLEQIVEPHPIPTHEEHVASVLTPTGDGEKHRVRETIGRSLSRAAAC